MALELVKYSDSRLDRSQLERFVNRYQSVAPLTIGELWAWPSALKLALIENIRRLSEEMMVSRDLRNAADVAIAQSESNVSMAGRPTLGISKRTSPAFAKMAANTRMRPSGS